jgi:uncharacterized protein (DUF1501 family)
MSEHRSCQEYQQISRRQFVGQAALAGAAVSVPFWMPKIAFAQSTSIKDVLVMVYLRGGADQLTFCVPHGDPTYYQVRDTLAIPQPGSGANAAIDLNGFFGFPQSFSALMEPYNSGHLGVIQAVGRQNWTRSHFDAQNWMHMDSSVVGSSGWLARFLQNSSPLRTDAPFRAISFGDALPLLLHKAPQAVAARRLDEYALDTGFTDESEINKTIQQMYARVRDEQRDIVRDAGRAANIIKSLNLGSYQSSSGVDYGHSYIGESLRSSAAIIKGNIGVEVLLVDSHGWDTHANQGSVSGSLNSMMTNLAQGLSAFYRDMMASGKTNWTLVVMSEFGRQVEENGSLGTDHGTAGCMLTMGTNVIGGIHCDWPGLEVENRFEGVDMRPTQDDRQVLRDLLAKRLAAPNIDAILPTSVGMSTAHSYFRAA